ncbi:hypothetical protein Hanom_Chr04g00303811 [Helianthus anomalus]
MKHQRFKAVKPIKLRCPPCRIPARATTGSGGVIVGLRLHLLLINQIGCSKLLVVEVTHRLAQEFSRQSIKGTEDGIHV